jgi:hypothetical protein
MRDNDGIYEFARYELTKYLIANGETSQICSSAALQLPSELVLAVDQTPIHCYTATLSELFHPNIIPALSFLVTCRWLSVLGHDDLMCKPSKNPIFYAKFYTMESISEDADFRHVVIPFSSS